MGPRIATLVGMLFLAIAAEARDDKAIHEVFADIERAVRDRKSPHDLEER